MSVMFCAGCGKDHDDFAWKHTTLETEDEHGNPGKIQGWFCRKWVTIGGGKSVNQWAEEIATPLWKIAGFKPTAKELHDEKVRKHMNLTHAQMQREKYKDMPRVAGGEKIKQDVLKGNLKQDDSPLMYTKKKK